MKIQQVLTGIAWLITVGLSIVLWDDIPGIVLVWCYCVSTWLLCSSWFPRKMSQATCCSDNGNKSKTPYDDWAAVKTTGAFSLSEKRKPGRPKKNK